MPLPALPSEVVASAVSAVIMGVFGLARALVKSWLWDRAEERKLRSAALPAASRPELAAPPDVGPLLLLIGAIGASAGAGYVGTPWAASALVQRDQLAGPTDKSCDPPCTRGQRCERGACTDAAQEPDKAPAPVPPPPEPPKRGRGRARSGGQVAATLPSWRDSAAAASPFDPLPTSAL